MSSNDNKENILKWEPILALEFRTVEFRQYGEDKHEKQVRALRVSEQEIKELAEEIGVYVDNENFEIDANKKIDPDKRLLEQFEYLQAFKDGEKWTVQSVKTVVLQNGEETIDSYISPNNKNLTALEAIGKLTAFEEFALADVSTFELVDLTIKDARVKIGNRHFIHTGEQEGLLFDKNLNAHKRINKFILPSSSNVGFNKVAVDRADKRWEEGKKLIANIDVSAENLLEEMTVGTPVNISINKVLKSIKGLNIMDEFAEKIDSSTDNLKNYIESYDNGPNGHYIDDAIDDLTNNKTGALSVLNKLKSENIIQDIRELTNFVNMAHVACYVINAQAMLKLLKSGKISDKKERQLLEKSLYIIGGEEDAYGKKVKIGEMEKIANKYNLPKNLIAEAKRAMAISTGPKIPILLTGYLKHYKERKKIFEKSQDKGQILDAKTVLPPTHKLTISRPGM